MSREEEIEIPVTTGEMIPVTTGTGATPCEVEEDGAPVLFGGMMPKITMQLKGSTWGRFSMITQETWSMTPILKRGSWYESYGRMGTLLGTMETETRREGEPPEYFLDSRLGILEQGYDQLMQTIENALANIPRLMGDAVQRELQARPVAALVVPQAVPGEQPGAPWLESCSTSLRNSSRFPFRLLMADLRPWDQFQATDLWNWKKTVCEYTKEFRRQAAMIQGWPDGVLAEQYQMGLNPDI
ncbi:UNVERIFIED_CONTAM: hypothetical protein K2H54_038239 [Gekko kuhli]